MLNQKNSFFIILSLGLIAYAIVNLSEGKGHSYYVYQMNETQKAVNRMNEAMGEDDAYVYCTDIPTWTQAWWNGT